MVKRACCGSIHRRRSSSDKIRSFFLKVQLHLQLADLFVELVLFGLGLLVHLLATVAEDVGQTGQRQLLPSTDLRRVNAEDLRDLSGCLVRLDGLHSNFGLQAGRVILTRSGHCLSSSILNAAHHLTKGLFRPQIVGSITHWRCSIFCVAGPLSVSCASSPLTSSATSWWLYSGAKRWRRRRLTRTSPSSPYRVIRRVICARLSPVIFSIYRRSKPRAVRPNASQFCSPRHPLTPA